MSDSVSGSTANTNGSGGQSDGVPISEVCFLAGTKIKTDQGFISIEKLKRGIHTIDELDILCITKTRTSESFLVKINKNALGRNKPSQDLIISKKHCIYYQGYWVEAENFLLLPGVEKQEYRGEILYNIVLEKYHKVNVYNLVCETLSPHCKVAKHFYKKELIYKN